VTVDTSVHRAMPPHSAYYFKFESAKRNVPGNPRCTMWLAQWYIATAKTAADLEPASDIIAWVASTSCQAACCRSSSSPTAARLILCHR